MSMEDEEEPAVARAPTPITQSPILTSRAIEVTLTDADDLAKFFEHLALLIRQGRVKVTVESVT